MVSAASQAPPNCCPPDGDALPAALSPPPQQPPHNPHNPISNPLTWSLFFSDSEDVSEFSSSVREGLP